MCCEYNLTRCRQCLLIYRFIFFLLIFVTPPFLFTINHFKNFRAEIKIPYAQGQFTLDEIKTQVKKDLENKGGFEGLLGSFSKIPLANAIPYDIGVKNDIKIQILAEVSGKTRVMYAPAFMWCKRQGELPIQLLETENKKIAKAIKFKQLETEIFKVIDCFDIDLSDSEFAVKNTTGQVIMAIDHIALVSTSTIDLQFSPNEDFITLTYIFLAFPAWIGFILLLKNGPVAFLRKGIIFFIDG